MRSVQAVGPCDEWTGALTKNGYGAQSIDGKVEYAHRVAWASVNGSIPAGIEIDHVCENKRCRRVSHLEPVTHAENARRSAAMSPLLLASVRALSKAGMSTRKIAAATGVSKTHVHAIISGRSWA